LQFDSFTLHREEILIFIITMLILRKTFPWNHLPTNKSIICNSSFKNSTNLLKDSSKTLSKKFMQCIDGIRVRSFHLWDHVRIWNEPKLDLWIVLPSFQCFKTRTGPAGRPGTRPTRAWDRSGWRQKPARELARWNPVDPAGRPGTRATRVNPAETRRVFFIYIYRDMERRRFGLLKGQNNKDKEQKCRADREKT